MIGCVAAIAIPNERSASSGTSPAYSVKRDEAPSLIVFTTAGSFSRRNVNVTSVSVAPEPTELSIELFDPNNEITWPVTITDASGTLVAAEPETQQDVPPVDRIAATTDPADPTRVELVWTFCGAPSPHRSPRVAR